MVVSTKCRSRINGAAFLTERYVDKDRRQLKRPQFVIHNAISLASPTGAITSRSHALLLMLLPVRAIAVYRLVNRRARFRCEAPCIAKGRPVARTALSFASS